MIDNNKYQLTGEFRTLEPVLFIIVFIIGFALMLLAKLLIITIITSIESIIGSLLMVQSDITGILGNWFNIVWIIISIPIAFEVARNAGSPKCRYTATKNSVSFRTLSHEIVYEYDDIEKISYKNVKILWRIVWINVTIKHSYSSHTFRYIYPLRAYDRENFPFTEIEKVIERYKSGEFTNTICTEENSDGRFGSFEESKTLSDSVMPSVGINDNGADFSEK